MGAINNAICKKCNSTFHIRRGGGFLFHLLNCNKCGDEKEVVFTDIMELREKYLIEKKILEKEYDRKVEEIMPICSCGGKFTFEAKPRCPYCNSDKYKIGELISLYD
ncbi:hypothetical protein [Marinifilum sp. D737]|uniref:hypothetical protein n=1 Tax=Marinifilum sp. D737 TaxID=2969628 RepID=UPI00227454C3|nr:hypothetical protein [Marinifilum sp. D737]MCY1636592.1 hypothetical protein [Marinifilum sp. D737]